MNSLLRSVRWAVALLAIRAIWPVVGLAASTDSPAKATYLKYCGACHGESGRGDGVVSGFLRPKPTDLTQIAKKAGGKYSSVQVMQLVDGTKTVRAHGDPNMPVWGEIFREQATMALPRRVSIQGKLLLIAEYLRSIQEQ